MKADAPRYQDFLQKEFKKRRLANAAYSLRAFARDLQIDISSLSRVLSGKQGLSLQKAKQISRHLELAPIEENYFCTQVEAQHGRSKQIRTTAFANFKNDFSIAELSLHQFETVSQWYYFAILELTTVDGFKSDPEWIAKRLNQPPLLIRDAIKKLLKLKLLEKTSTGQYKKTAQYRAAVSTIPNRALKEHQHQILKKAEAALYDQDLALRDYSTVTFALNTKDLPWAKEMLKKFRRKFTQRLASTPQKDRLYELSIQLFALDYKTLNQNQKEKEK